MSYPMAEYFNIVNKSRCKDGNFDAFFSGEFEVFTNEAVLPTVDWDCIEENLQGSQQRENRVSNYFLPVIK